MIRGSRSTEERVRGDLCPKPSTLRGVDPTVLEQDQELSGIPAQFVKDVLKDLAPRLLAGINCTSLDPTSAPSPDKQLPSHARCIFAPSLAPESSPVRPNFLLALTFPARDPSSHSSPTRILVPCHSLVYSLASPLFPFISHDPEEEEEDENDVDESATSTEPPSPSLCVLPILGPIELPSLPAFAILHAFLHTRSLSALQHSLTTTPPSPSRLPSPPPSPRLGESQSPSGSTARRNSMDRTEAQELMDKIQNLRTTAIRLQISDPVLWQGMSSSWNQVISQLP
ncbi:uncharacterized protein JCM6883_001359 [Sporobolomyces salmoneus]|uniref:uncharacterized protein n=1 Tax=Sporobolomyces salmoneus TaxID=183962 RepID=UPI0031771AA7